MAARDAFERRLKERKRGGGSFIEMGCIRVEGLLKRGHTGRGS